MNPYPKPRIRYDGGWFYASNLPPEVIIVHNLRWWLQAETFTIACRRAQPVNRYLRPYECPVMPTLSTGRDAPPDMVEWARQAYADRRAALRAKGPAR